MRIDDSWAELIAGILLLILILMLALVEAWVGVWLWGLIMVGIFGFPVLTFWQFYGLMILLRILLPSSGMQYRKES